MNKTTSLEFSKAKDGQINDFEMPEDESGPKVENVEKKHTVVTARRQDRSDQRKEVTMTRFHNKAESEKTSLPSPTVIRDARYSFANKKISRMPGGEQAANGQTVIVMPQVKLEKNSEKAHSKTKG